MKKAVAAAFLAATCVACTPLACVLRSVSNLRDPPEPDVYVAPVTDAMTEACAKLVSEDRGRDLTGYALGVWVPDWEWEYGDWTAAPPRWKPFTMDYTLGLNQLGDPVRSTATCQVDPDGGVRLHSAFGRLKP